MNKFKIINTLLISIFFCVLIYFVGPFKYFKDIPSLIFVSLLGGLGFYLTKDSNSFSKAGWIVFLVGLIGGLNQSEFNLGYISVSLISLLYGYILEYYVFVLRKRI